MSSFSRPLRRAKRSEKEVKLKIEDLMRRGKDVNVQGVSGKTPLHEACLEWVRSLYSGYNNGELALGYLDDNSKVKDLYNVIKLLLRSGAEVNVQDNRGRTPLHDVCSKLYRQRFSLPTGQLTSRLASHSGFDDIPDVIDLLLRSGAEVNIQDNQGSTILHEACKNRNQKMVKTLLRNGAKIDVNDRSSRSPLHVACCGKHYRPEISIVNALLCNGGEGLGFEERTLSHYSKDEEILYVVNLKDRDGNTALHLASRANQKEVICLLFRVGAKVGVKNEFGMTALHCAAEGGSADVVDVLLDNGEDLNAKDCFGNTPLHLVSRLVSFNSPSRDTVNIIENLLSKGAKIYEKNNYQETPYEIIVKCNHLRSIDPYRSIGAHFPSSKKMDDIENIFIKHVIKLRALTNQVRFDLKWKRGQLNFYKQSRSFCYELEDMKSTIIVKDTSLYNVLSHRKHSYPLSTEDLLRVDEFLCSPDMLKRFPLYGPTLRAAFQRPKLLTLAVQSFYAEHRKQMVKELPFDVIEQLLVYLTNEDMRNFLKSE